MMPLRGLILLILSCFAGNALALATDLTLPDSLAKWYKPQNKRQVWLHTMFGLRRELQAIREYSDEGDVAALQKWTQKFLKHYRSLPQMVPQWREEVDLDYANKLEQAAAQGDLKKIKRASKQITQTCRQCHKSYQLLARLRYRSADFSALRIEHGGKDYRFSRFKTELARSLNRIKIAVTDQHWRKAELALSDLQHRLDSFGQRCASCHQDDVPYQRILGTGSAQDFSQLARAIREQDSKLAARSLGGAAVHVCARCHGIHRSLSEVRRLLFEK